MLSLIHICLGDYVCCLVVTKTGMNPWVAAVLAMLVVGVVAGVIFFPSPVSYTHLIKIPRAFARGLFNLTRPGIEQHGPAQQGKQSAHWAVA